MATYNQLSYGSKGSGVTELQKLLNQNGYTLDEDGDFGNKTLAAVKDYQQKNGLDVDGIVGNNTWGALTKASTTNQPTASTPAADTGFKYDAYQESDAVKQAQAMLNQQLSQKPGAYTSAWQTQLNDTINKILNREKFSYDLNGDALYQQYKDQAMLQGKQAMMDTMGQAQAMTGGYGNSYAQTAGQQAYQGHIQQLNDKIPELYQLAMSKYQMEGDALTDQAALLAQQEQLDYGRHRDQVADYNAELDRVQDRYDTERDYDYGKWADNRDFSYGQYIDDRNLQYQQDRDKVSDQQWQAEFDEALRQWNHENGVATAGNPDDPVDEDSPSSPGSKYNADTAAVQKMLKEAGYDIEVDGLWGPKTQAAYEDYNSGGGGNGFTGTTYSEAVAYMKQNGVSGAEASAVMTESEWKRRKSAGSSNAAVKNYDSYQEYLADYVEFKTSK